MHDVKPVRGGRVIRWMAGLAVSALLVGAGVALGSHLTAAGSPARGGTRFVSDTAVSSGRADGNLKYELAGLRTCLKAARQLARTPNRAAARAKARACIREYHAGGLLLVRRLLHLGGEYGQITFKTKKGSVTVAFERGVIQTVSSGSATVKSVAVKAADGTIQTWNLVRKTVIVRAWTRVSASALAAGRRVFVVGAVVGGVDDARLIIIRG